MAKPMVVSLSHDLGKAEAKRRLTDGLASVRSHYGQYVDVGPTEWTGDRLAFSVAALKQTASGTVDVEDNRVTLTVTLPLLLAMVAEKARSLIQKEGTLLLEKK